MMCHSPVCPEMGVAGGCEGGGEGGGERAGMFGVRAGGWRVVILVYGFC